jgi:hypothetical protein
MRKLSLLTILAIFAFGSHAIATVFDLSPTNGLGAYDSDLGAGQGVVVTTTQTITDMGFYLDEPNGGNLKFMIWDATNSALLFSSVLNPGPSPVPQWVYSNPFNFTVNAGQTYWFGVINDHSFMQLGTITPPIVYSNDGLAAVTGGSSNYANFASPVFTGYTPGMEVGLRLDGEPVPEPSSLIMLGSGLLGVAGVTRRHLLCRKSD